MTEIVFGRAADAIDAAARDRRTIVVTDANVARLYPDLTGRFDCIAIAAGERHKTLSTVECIYDRLIDMGADRDVLIIGVGGGVVTDIAGFVASTWMRGVSFGFVPTTLLAQVDAAIGGKNGVDVGGFKNMAGTFAHPEFVLCDTRLLATLPDSEVRAGAAEALKAGVIADPALFGLFEGRTLADIRCDEALLADIVRRAIDVKMSIVGRDFRESGERRLLNLGHTVGHAIEKVSPEWLHGEAVAVGMAVAAGMAVRLGVSGPDVAARITEALRALGLPTVSGLDSGLIMEALRGDKKRTGDGVRFVLPTGIGSCTVRTLSFDDIAELL